MSGIYLGARLPNLKFVSLAIKEQVAFDAPKYTRSRDPSHAPFYPLLHSGVGGRQDTPFELLTAIIGP